MIDMIENDKHLEKYISQRIAEHKETFDPDKVRDFIDLYLKVNSEGHKAEAITGKDFVSRSPPSKMFGSTSVTNI